MKAEFYLPYYPEGTVAGNGNDMSDEEYARKLTEMFGSGYNSFMDRAMFSDDRYGVHEVIPEEYAIGSVEDSQQVEYYGFECMLNNENDEPMSMSEFNFNVDSNDMCAFFVHMSVDDEYRNTDAVNELNFWLKESKQIMDNPHIDNGHRIGMLPYKDIIINVPEVDGLVVPGKFKLIGTRVVDQDNPKNFAVIVNRIERN